MENYSSPDSGSKPTQFRTVWVDDEASSATVASEPASGWRCPWCGSRHGGVPALALHMAQCPSARRAPPRGRRLSAGPAASSASSARPPDGVRYRYMRVLQRDPLDAANRTVTLIPLVEARPFCCAACGRGFSTLGGLRKHARVHLRQGSRQAEAPPDSAAGLFLRRHEWTQHLQHAQRAQHAQLKPHQCSACGKAFRTAGYLTVHARMHTGDRPFVCRAEGCGKGFARRCNLRAHLVSHTRERPHGPHLCSAPGCGLRFQFRKQLEQHVKQCQLVRATISRSELAESANSAVVTKRDLGTSNTSASELDAPEYIDIETFGAMHLAACRKAYFGRILNRN